MEVTNVSIICVFCIISQIPTIAKNIAMQQISLFYFASFAVVSYIFAFLHPCLSSHLLYPDRCLSAFQQTYAQPIMT